MLASVAHVAFPEHAAPGATENVLAAKLTPPPLPSWLVRRPRLANQIAAGAQRPLTVLAGPPGAGKTVAAAAWAADRTGPGPVAWVSVDSYDNWPGSFWRHVTEALRRAGVPGPAPGRPARTAPRAATALCSGWPPPWPPSTRPSSWFSTTCTW